MLRFRREPNRGAGSRISVSLGLFRCNCVEMRKLFPSNNYVTIREIKLTHNFIKFDDSYCYLSRVIRYFFGAHASIERNACIAILFAFYSFSSASTNKSGSIALASGVSKRVTVSDAIINNHQGKICARTAEYTAVWKIGTSKKSWFISADFYVAMSLPPARNTAHTYMCCIMKDTARNKGTDIDEALHTQLTFIGRNR